ncbi:predicted protein [Histoplasma capsulatum G186AR]|uniref:Uncharacterized protein n=2 Tax=Ajellomyces capsulatus TaxID=5037 RepID=C0NX42_AJECG|nr:uncharacterized protein HCBG_08034 [Histoplasma capsulatum G186AR]EEH03908.1 predicted protein [Histoplasma capsulatum G186AR]
MHRMKSLVHREPREPRKSGSSIERERSTRKSNAVLAGQGSHLADLRSDWESEKVQPRYPDEEAAFSSRSSSPELRHRRIDSGVAGLESSQQKNKESANGRPTHSTATASTREQNVPMHDGNQRNHGRFPVSMRPGDVSSGQRQQSGQRKVGEAAAFAAATAYFHRRPNEPVEVMRSGEAIHRLHKSKEPLPMSAWGKGRECRPLAHDPLAGVPRRDSSTLGSFESPVPTPSTERKSALQRAAQTEPAAADTALIEKSGYRPEGYTGMTQEPDRREYEGQYEKPSSPDAPMDEKGYDKPVSGDPGKALETPMQEKQNEGLSNDGQGLRQEDPTVQSPRLTHVTTSEHDPEEIATREEATRRAVVEEAAARRKAAEEVAARETVSREAATEENIARETAQGEVSAMEDAIREAYANENLARESAAAEISMLEEETRQAMARETAAREAAIASIQSTEIATREAIEREALMKQKAVEEIATREAVTSEAVASEVATREAANREAAIKQANTREVAAEEVAAREAALRAGGFDEAVARDAALREVAAEETTAMQAEGRASIPQEPGSRGIHDYETGPGSVATGGAFAEEPRKEQIVSCGAAPCAQPADIGVSSAPTAQPVTQTSHAEQDPGAHAQEQRPDGVEPEGRGSFKEEKELRKQISKEEKAIRKERDKMERKLNRERAKKEKTHQAQLKKEERANKQRQKSQKKQEKEAKRQEEIRNRSATADEGQRENKLLAKIRRLWRNEMQ